MKGAEALTDTTATHSVVSSISDASELGSEPHSWLESRCLRTRKKSQIVRTRGRHRERAWVLMRGEALTDRTATHRPISPLSDPSELGSEPDSWLESRCLRTCKMIHIERTRVSQDWGSRSAIRS
jgi:hypothetical protein